MKVIAWVVSRAVSETTKVDSVIFSIQFIVSTGVYQSELSVELDILKSEDQIKDEIRVAVADAVNAALKESVTAADVLMV